MIRDALKDPRKRAFLALAVLGLLALSLVWPLAIGRDARHLTAYREGDEDVSQLRQELADAGVQVHAIHSTPHLLGDVEAPGETLLVIAGNERRYGASEAEAVLAFLERGGSVILADETGFGTDVARAAGFVFSSERLLDDRSNLRGVSSLVVADATLGTERYRLLFNSPTSIGALSRAGAYDVLALSSPAVGSDGSFLDRNGNGEIDQADSAGPFPLIVRTTLGQGTLVLVADTGLLMNEQMAIVQDDAGAPLDNAAFLRALVASLVPTDGAVLLDESRHAPTPLLAPWSNGVRALGRLTSGPVAPLATLALLLAATLAIWRATRETEDWSHHRHDVTRDLPLSADVQPDASRLQRMARRRVSERFNIPLEQVAAMKTEELQALTGDKPLSEAAAGDVRGDLAPHFRALSFAPASAPSPSTLPPEATP